MAGGHARSYYEMAPASIVIRLTSALVAGFDTYGFDADGNFSELNRINENDLPASEFWLGGEIVRKMSEEQKAKLKGAHLYDNPQKLIADLAEAFLQ